MTQRCDRKPRLRLSAPNALPAIVGQGSGAGPSELVRAGLHSMFTHLESFNSSICKVQTGVGFLDQALACSG